MEGPTVEHRQPDLSFWERVDRWLSTPGPLGMRYEDWFFIAALWVILLSMSGLILILGD